MEVEFTMKKFRILLMMVLCLAFASTAAFAAAANKAVDNVVSMHGQIVSINDDMITIKDTNSDNTVALIVRWDTEILNGKNGEDVDLNRLHVGDELTAYYSSISTRSLPPQSRAYALVMGDGQHDGIYMHVSKVDKVKNGVNFLNTNEDMFVTIPENVEDDAKELKQGDKVLVWYDFVAMSMPGQATATKAVILD